MHSFRRFASILLIGTMALLIGSFSAQAQDTAVRWSAYLFNSQTSDLIRVFQDGAQTPYNLGLGPGIYVSGYDLAFTQDGNKVAFCVVNLPNDGGQGEATLIVRDLQAQQNNLELDLGKAIGCRTGHHAFNSDGSQFTVARVNYYPGDPNANPQQPTWQLLVVDTATGGTVQETNAQSPAVTAANIGVDAPILPYVQYFNANQVIFAAVPYGGGESSAFQGYLWQTDSGSVTPIDRWGNLNVDVLPATGELIWVNADANRPAASPGGPMPAYNELKLADKTGQEKIIYYSADWVLTNAQFINNGQQIAIEEVSSFDPNHPDQVQQTKWIALDRSGTVSDLQTMTFYGSLVGAPSGYAILDTEYADATQTMPKFNFNWYANGQATTLWTFNAPDSSSTWEIAWSAYVSPAQNLQPFPAVG